MLISIFYAAIRFSSGAGSLALLNIFSTQEIANDVTAIYVSQTLIGAVACFGLQFDAYHIAINKSKSNITPTLSASAYSIIVTISVVGSLTLYAINSSSKYNLETKLIAIMTGSIIFSIACIYGNFNTGLDKKGTATFLFLTPNIPILAVSASQIINYDYWINTYITTSILILFIFFFLQIRIYNPDNILYIEKSGRIGKMFAGFSQPLIVWSLLHNVTISHPLNLASYLLIQRIFDGISSLTMLSIQTKQIKEIILIIEKKSKGLILLKYAESVFLIISFSIVAIIVSSIYNTSNTLPINNIKTYVLEIIIIVSKLSLAIVSLLLMRFRLKISTFFEVATVLFVCTLLQISSEELMFRQFSLIIGYTSLASAGAFFLRQKGFVA